MTVADLATWLHVAGETPGIDALDIVPLAGDLSQRRYFRVRRAAGDSLLAAHYPESLRPDEGALHLLRRSLTAGTAVYGSR